MSGADPGSLLRARLACSLLAASADVRLAGEFVDEQIDSGDQPGFDRLLKAIADDGRGAYVILSSLDHLGATAKIRRTRARAVRAAGGQAVILNGVEVLPPKEDGWPVRL